jgi:hypothetical protein
MKWKEKVYRTFTKLTKEEPSFSKQYDDLKVEIDEVGIHLAVFGEPFLTLLLDGKKTVESRFSLNNISPFGKVNPGDFVFIKRSGGPICGYFIVRESHYFKTGNRGILENIRKNFGKQICDNAVEDFWKHRQRSNYISLFEVAYAGRLSAVTIDKRDRTAWTVIRTSLKDQIMQI